ncbi:MAG: acylphosphatase [Nitrososphaerota archaeon]|nr:acylphosphatase [Candidatus Calditenuaceae archaeon]MDW8072916.1 acylphosphatase [Nitrososphaerota archaeon]
MPNVRVRVYVSGKVQGVFYRQNAKRMAESLGLKGWVRNLPDGRVEAVIEGRGEAVRMMIEWMREGPPSARVEKVDVYEEDYSGEFREFSIIY